MRYLAASLVLLSFFAFGDAAAQRFPGSENEIQPLDRILEGIRRSQPGQFSDVQGPQPGPRGEPHYYIKWLTPDGRVLWLDTDARTGRVLGVQGGGQFGPQDRFPPPQRILPRPRYGPDGPPDGPYAAPDDRDNARQRGPDMRRRPQRDDDNSDSRRPRGRFQNGR